MGENFTMSNEEFERLKVQLPGPGLVPGAVQQPDSSDTHHYGNNDKERNEKVDTPAKPYSADELMAKFKLVAYLAPVHARWLATVAERDVKIAALTAVGERDTATITRLYARLLGRYDRHAKEPDYDGLHSLITELKVKLAKIKVIAGEGFL